MSYDQLGYPGMFTLHYGMHPHAVMMERKLYGPMGYNMMYPFAVGDLRDSAVILSNYMENSGGGKIPWMDLKYLFGEIMYGGHIVNDFDRLTCKVYLDFFMKDELLERWDWGCKKRKRPEQICKRSEQTRKTGRTS